MDALTQFHVLRRLSPVIGALKDLAGDAPKGLDSLGPIAEVAARLPDDDVNYIVDRCLSTVQRKKDGDTGWVAVWNASAKRPMFEDIDMLAMLMISGNVVMNAIGPFSFGRP
nr:hypothetical protein [Bosea sp. AS-1]